MNDKTRKPRSFLPVAALILLAAIFLGCPQAREQGGMETLAPWGPLTSSGPQTCPPNQVMHGLQGLTPICMPASCPSGFLLRGIVNNQPVCDPNVGQTANCDGNKVMRGFDASGNAICVDPPAGAQGPQGPQGPAGVAGGGLKYAVGTGCGQCPHGSSGNVCKFKNQNGDLLNATAVGGSCRAGLADANFGFWTY